MDERKENGSTEVKQDVAVGETNASRSLELAFARGSGHLNDPHAAPERTEHSVMAGLPPDKQERIAAMRRELADLQRQLIDAQQRIATELQGRAEDAERFEALETKFEAKAEQDAKRITELESELTSVRAQLTTITTTTEDLRKVLASRDAQIDEARQQHRAVAEQVEAQRAALEETKSQLTSRDADLATKTSELDEQRRQHIETKTRLEAELESLRETKALVATREADLATMTTERDTLKTEAAAARVKLRDVANQLARLGNELVEGGGDASQARDIPQAQPIVAPSGEAPSTPKINERPKPPPVPARASQPKMEPVIVLEEPKRSRMGLGLVGGAILGVVATLAIVKLSSADAPQNTAAPQAALATERPVDPSPPSVEPAVAPSPSMTDTVNPPASDPATTPPPAPAPAVAPPAEAKTEGVLVLPQDADGHRLFVDGKVIPVKSLRAVVPCGSREVRIGSRGTPRTFEVACGGETTVPPDPNDR